MKKIVVGGFSIEGHKRIRIAAMNAAAAMQKFGSAIKRASEVKIGQPL